MLSMYFIIAHINHFLLTLYNFFFTAFLRKFNVKDNNFILHSLYIFSPHSLSSTFTKRICTYKITLFTLVICLHRILVILEISCACKILYTINRIYIYTICYSYEFSFKKFCSFCYIFVIYDLYV